MKLVLDTNCLIQVIPSRSRYHSVWQSFERGENTLCVSTEIMDEYAEILQKLTDTETSELVLSTIINSPFVRFITPYFKFNLIVSDPDDNKFVDCAFAAGADYLVSEDSHFQVLRNTPFPQLNLVTLDEFMETRLIKE